MSVKIGGFVPTPLNYQYSPFSEVRTGLDKLSVSASNEYRIPEYTPVMDQLQLSSCVANATCGALEVIRGLEDPNNITLLSRLFIYYNARMYDHDTDKDEGTHIANAFDSLKRFGVCPESEWPYNPNFVFAQPSVKAYKTSNDNEISDFYRIDSYDEQRLLDIESAIRANHPVVFGTTVGQELETYTGGNKVFGPPQDIKGGHAMCIVGVRRNPNLEFYIKNSWSDSWGDAGHAWFNAAYIMLPQTSDIWVPTRMGGLTV